MDASYRIFEERCLMNSFTVTVLLITQNNKYGRIDSRVGAVAEQRHCLGDASYDPLRWLQMAPKLWLL